LIEKDGVKMRKSVFEYKMELLKELETERTKKRNELLAEKKVPVEFHKFCKLNNIRLLPVEKIRDNIGSRNIDIAQVFDIRDPIYQDYLADVKNKNEIIDKKIGLVNKEIDAILHDALFTKGFDFDAATKRFKRTKF